MKKLIILVLALTLSFCALCFGAAAASSAPQQDASGVYQISSAEDLRAFAALVNGDDGDTDANAVLTWDIGLGGANNSWTPIGDYTNRYTGTFDGQGHTISGLYCDVSDDYSEISAGLFGYVGKGTVKNVSVSGTVSNNGGYAGGVCGYNDGGTITNCSSACTVSGEYAGGVCGSNDGGTIENCYWLSDTVDDMAKTAAQFASGEVAWALNHGQVNGPWRQDLDEDTVPTLDSTHEVVVKLTVDGIVSFYNSGYVFEGDETSTMWMTAGI